MIWKRRDAEFAEKTCRRKPLRSPRLRVSNPDQTQTQTILKHRGTEITEEAPNQNSVSSVPLCFYLPPVFEEAFL
jgi:hypothetical protein